MQIAESSPDPSKLRPLHEGTSAPSPFFGLKRADLRDLSFIGWAIFAFFVTIALHMWLREDDQRDFVYFYSIGHLLNDYSPTRLYDFALQEELSKAMLPGPLKVGQVGVFVYPPHVAMLFQPFARLSYWTACRLWLAISLTLYLTGLWLLIRRFCGDDPLKRSLVLLFGLSFWPFISWILLGGQLSAIGFLAMALAIYWEDMKRHFLSGLALSVCIYKPTLLLLILPMLLIIRRPRTLAGFGAGAFITIAVTTMALGPQVWLSYIGAAASRTTEAFGVSPPTLDLRAVSDAVSHSNRFVGVLVLCAGGFAGVCLASIWWRARHYTQRGPATLTWATTITWTLLLNVYVPVYDSVLVIVSIIATAAILVQFAPRLFPGLCLVLLVSSYPSAWLSTHTGWQILTPMLAAIGLLQMFACFNVLVTGQRDSRQLS